MNGKMRVVLFIIISFSLLACSLGNLITINFGGAPTKPIPIQSTAAVQSVEILNICSQEIKSDVETILAEPVSEPKNINGSCVFTNTRDSLYMVSIAVGQDDLAKGILQGQAMMLGFAGAPLDDTRMAKLKSLSDVMDFKGFFSELVTTVEGLPSPRARVVADQKSDPVYWVWISAQSRRQASLVAVRGPSVVNINLIVADSMSEDSMLAASLALADKMFNRLPPRFSMATPMAPPGSSEASGSQSPVGTPTPVFGPTAVGTPTLVFVPIVVGTPTLLAAPLPWAVLLLLVHQHR